MPVEGRVLWVLHLLPVLNPKRSQWSWGLEEVLSEDKNVEEWLL